MIKPNTSTNRPRIYTIPLASVYPYYIEKARKKDRGQAEVDEILRWLTGYSQKQLQNHLNKQTDLETFFAQAPRPNPNRHLVTGIICGLRVEDIEDPITQDIRYMDKLIDELGKGKAMEKILREPQ